MPSIRTRRAAATRSPRTTAWRRPARRPLLDWSCAWPQASVLAEWHGLPARTSRGLWILEQFRMLDYHQSMATAIVTGGAGFLGSHLCDYLLAREYRVICVDNLDTGSLLNLEHIRDENFVFVNHDLTEPFFIEESIDVVYHLASPASPIDYMRLPLHTLKVGSYG